MDDIITRLIDMPTRIKGFTLPDPDGNYNIYLNQNLTQEEIDEIYRHEIKHIELGHFCSFKTVAELEAEI